MNIAFLTDEIESIKPHKDSSFAMMLAAQQLGFTVYYFTLNDLYCEQGQAFAKASLITVFDNKTPFYNLETEKITALESFDMIFMRKDPPFDMEYIYATYALELAEKKGVLVVNKPQSLRDANEKFYTLHFPQCAPTTLVSRSIEQLRDFWQQHSDVIFKPLEGMGGKSVFRVADYSNNLTVILEVLTDSERKYIMAQKFIPQINESGDKRILLIDGKPIPYALARIPAKGETRGNLAAGATGKVVPITPRDEWLCNQIAPALKEKGLIFVGIDVIGDYLTEINVTSPTCIREIEKETGLTIAQDLIQQCHILHEQQSKK
jgi:glutathione synthase